MSRRSAARLNGVMAKFSAVFAFVALVSILVLGLFDAHAAWRGWYFGAFFALHAAVGCVAISFVADLTKGTWGRVIAPYLEAGAGAIPFLLIVLAVPLIMPAWIFPWTDMTSPAMNDDIPLTKAEYFNHFFFFGRCLFYVLAFLVLWKLAQRVWRAFWREEQFTASGKSAAGLVLLAVTVFFFTVDFVMSLEPHWYSTGMPVIMMISGAFAGFAGCVAAWALWSPFQQLRYSEKVRRDLANLLLAMMMFWLYVVFAQFLIIWMGNLSHDVGWYLHRAKPGWIALSWALFVFAFLVPFLLLLNRRIKVYPRRIGVVALVLFLGQIFYVSWTLLPSWQPVNGWLVAASAAGVLAVGGFWVWRLAVGSERRLRSHGRTVAE